MPVGVSQTTELRCRSMTHRRVNKKAIAVMQVEYLKFKRVPWVITVNLSLVRFFIKSVKFC